MIIINLAISVQYRKNKANFFLKRINLSYLLLHASMLASFKNSRIPIAARKPNKTHWKYGEFYFYLLHNCVH